jgi:hypothetical protein
MQIKFQPVFFLFAFSFISPLIFAQSFHAGTPASNINLKNPTITFFQSESNRSFIFSDWEFSSLPRYQVYVVNSIGNTATNEIEMPEVKDPGIIADVIGTSERLFLFRSVYLKSEKKHFLLSHLVTFQGQVSSDGAEVCAIPSDKESRGGEFGINESPMGKSVAVLGLYPREKDKNEKANLVVLDAYLEKQWTRDIEFNSPAGKIPFNDIFISDKGTVCILKKSADDNFSVYVLKDEKAVLKETKLEMPQGKKIVNYIVNFDANDNVLIGGTYTDISNVNKANPLLEGNYFFSILAGGDVLAKATNAFAAPVKNLEVRYLIPVEENKVLLACEIFKKERSGTSVNGEDAVFYSGGKGYLFMLDKNGKNLWTGEVEKESKSENDGGVYMQYGLQVIGNKICVFFNDEKMKYSTEAGQMPFMVRFDLDGKKENAISIANTIVGGKRPITLLPSISLKKSDDEILFLGMSEENIYPLTMKFK